MGSYQDWYPEISILAINSILAKRCRHRFAISSLRRICWNSLMESDYSCKEIPPIIAKLCAVRYGKWEVLDSGLNCVMRYGKWTVDGCITNQVKEERLRRIDKMETSIIRSLRKFDIGEYVLISNF